MRFYIVIRVILGMLFLWAGLSKFMDIRSFCILIDAYGLIPKSLVMPAAIALVSLEIIAGAGLMLDIYGSLTTITCLTVLFMSILLYGIRMGLDIDCGCFAPSDPEAKAFHGLRNALYRDFAMMGGILYLYFWRYYQAVRPRRLNFFAHDTRRNEG